jgi:acetoin utilization deacetylase AcuC-like enzyme
MGFCLLANGALAVEAALADGLAERIAVLDWDVHHGNGTEAVFYERGDVLTVSIHQERNFPLDTGAFSDRGGGAGEGANLNVPLPPGAGHETWLLALERLALRAIEAFCPDAVLVACGYDASAFDPLGRMLATAETFGAMTAAVRDLAARVCGGRLVLMHEGGYSETHVPFCGHAAIEALTGTAIRAPDPFAETLLARQPGPAHRRMCEDMIAEMAEALAF